MGDLVVPIYLLGQRGTGKTTVASILASKLFQAKHGVTLLPEWRFSRFGPEEVERWIEAVERERVHQQSTLHTAGTPVAVVDRSMVCLEALIRAVYPEALQGHLARTETYSEVSGLYVLLTASAQIRSERIRMRDGVATIQTEATLETYQVVLERIGIRPHQIDTDAVAPSDVADKVYTTFQEFRAGLPSVAGQC